MTSSERLSRSTHRKVLCFTTGGTIASSYDPDARGFLPTISGDSLLSSMPGIESLGEVEVIELARVTSSRLRPEEVFSWAQQVRARLIDEAVTGAVVIVGTNALEEAAYLFDLSLQESKPIVFTGSMRVPGDLAFDGWRNITSSVRVALDRAARDCGVLVVLNDEIHTAKDVAKTHPYALNAFTSPGVGPIGFVLPALTEPRVAFCRRLPLRDHINCTAIESRVAYVKTVLGEDAALIDAALESGTRGIVIEGFAGGDATSFMAEGIERALAEDVPVVIASRTLGAEAGPLYADVGEGLWLRDRGALFAGSLSGPKARIKLMLLLGSPARSRLSDHFP